jgi:hypothetical protein
METSTNKIAAPGQVFVCPLCGRRAKDKNGTLEPKIHTGWDTSCRTHSVLCREEDLVLKPDGTVAKLKDGCSPIEEVPN